MFVAETQDGARIYADDADKGGKYFCPICKHPVILRVGDINAWHFAHHTNDECSDTWNYDMSEWHRNMQARFAPEYREVVLKHNGKTHRADILKGNTVIEFQHSPISANEIRERNSFYTKAGYRVAWVFDVRDKKEYFEPKDMDNYNILRWKFPLRCLYVIKPKANSNIALCLHLDDRADEEDPENRWDELKRINWCSSDADGYPNYKYIAVDDEYDIEIKNDMDLDDFFLTKNQRIWKLIRSKAPYTEKHGRVKGYPRNTYICPRTNDWINYDCEHCVYCIAAEHHVSGHGKNPGRYYYCKYGYGQAWERKEDDYIIVPQFDT